MSMELTERLKKKPEMGKNVFVARGAHVVGEVILREECSVWFGAVLRGDSDLISVGARSNVQDNAVLHADPGDPCIIGDDCVIGHCAIVHGARLSHHVLVGMHATVLNNAEIGEYSIIGANALVPTGMKIPPYSLVLGVPAKVVKTLDESVHQRIQDNVDEYVRKASAYAQAGFNTAQ
ncbi:MAG: gamma carbonic anhydrase family protein [Sphingomonadales bacterium]|jgi:carbonic anhydrase/acetyltransferase-like protein (isoleucine patch superfamily)